VLLGLARLGGELTELRSLLFVLGALIVYRIGTFIPGAGRRPGRDAALMEQQQGTILTCSTCSRAAR
jgi:preprotein translocase subunit SecY